MTDRAIVRMARIAHEYDLAGRPREADIIEAAMIRIAQESAVGNWRNGVKQVGQGIEDDAKAVGNSLAAPFEGAAAGAKAAWDGGGLAYAPHAAGQALTQAWDRANADYGQEMQQYDKAAPALAGPGGTGFAGAVVQDGVTGLQNTAQGYVGGIVNQQTQAQQAAYVQNMLQQAL